MVALAKHETVLHFAGENGDRALFMREPEEPGEAASVVLELPVPTWLDFGSPREVTVTVRAGDRLNPDSTDKIHTRRAGDLPYPEGT